MKYLIIILALSLTSCTYTTKMARNSFIATQIIDTLQTREALKQPDKYREINPLIKDKKDLYVIKGGTTLGIIYLSSKLKPKAERNMLTFCTIVGIYCIVNNDKVGIKINF